MRLELAISALGLVTPVGLDVVQSAAAQRAGLAQPRRLDAFELDVPFDRPQELDDGDVVSIAVGHRVAGLTDGFTQTGLWLRMAVVAVRDALAQGALPGAADPFWDRTALHVVVADVTTERFSWPADEVAEILEWSFFERLADLAPLAAKADRQRVSWGHAGGAAGTTAARELLARGAFDRVLLVAVDSYCDFPTMKALLDDGRLKSPDVQTGLQPGEAAAAILLERPEVAAQRKAEVGAKILAARHEAPAAPPPPFGGGEPGDHAAYFVRAGALLAKVVAETLADAGIARFAGDIVLDLNGEEWRAAAWGTAQTRLQHVIDFDASKAVLPCASFGEIGAASGLAGVCLAARSFAREYATGDATLVVSLAENGEVGAIVVGKP